jgi:hypothetical protein
MRSRSVMKTHASIASALLVASQLLACGGGDATPPPIMPPPAAPSATPPLEAAQAPAAPSNEGEKLLIAVTACTFGGVWGDAEGDAPDQRKAASEMRCRAATQKIWGNDDQTHYEKLRAYDAGAVDDVAAKIEKVSKADSVDAPHADALVKTWRAIAAAQKETEDARRAGDRVKRDYEREPERLSTDEVASVGALKQSTALTALLALDVGDLSHDAHAIGVLIAMDRAAIARGLPKHLKVYAVEGAFAELFNVPPPPVPEDATKKLKPGMWLTYLMDSAKAAGHPVPAAAKTPKQKEPLAWAGTLEGISDKLKADAAALPKTTELADVALRVTHRLDADFEAENTAFATTSKPAAKKK